MFSPKHFEELVIDDIVVFYVAKCEMRFVDCFLFMVIITVYVIWIW